MDPSISHHLLRFRPSSTSKATRTLLAQVSKDSARIFSLCSMAGSSSKVYRYLEEGGKEKHICASSLTHTFWSGKTETVCVYIFFFRFLYSYPYKVKPTAGLSVGWGGVFTTLLLIFTVYVGWTPPGHHGGWTRGFWAASRWWASVHQVQDNMLPISPGLLWLPRWPCLPFPHQWPLQVLE